MAKRVQMTGAGGFVSKVLGERFASAGFAVRAVSRRPEALAGL